MSKYLKFSKNYFYIIFLILFPYLYLSPLTFGQLSMGNDFEGLYFSYKKFIFDFYKNDLFIYWSPSESSGYSLIYNPFAQYFYIPGWIFLNLIKIFNFEFTRHYYLLYTIFGISIFNIGNFLWLKKLNFNPLSAIFACLIVSMSLKVTEILRFPNAIHTFCWFSWMLYGLTLTKYKNKILKSSVIIVISWLFILTAGYPYYIYYSLILFLFYFIFISLNFSNYFLKINLNNKNSLIKSIIITFFSGLISSLIAFPWLYKIKEILDLTRDRDLKDYEFTNILNSNFIDHVGSWIMPPISIAEGWYYNGIIVTFLILFFITGVICNRDKKYFNIIIFLSVFYFTVYQFSKAGDSFLFKLFSDQIDFLKNARAWSRINIILVPFISLLIALSIEYIKENNKNFNHKIIFFISLTLIIYTQYNLVEYDSGWYWETWQGNRINFIVNWFKQDIPILSNYINLYNGLIYFIFGILSFIIFLIFLFFKEEILKKNYLYVLIIFFVFAELFFLSNIQWALPKSSWSEKYGNDNQIIESLNKSFEKPSFLGKVYGKEYYKRDKTFIVNYIENFGYDAHSKLFDQYLNRNGKKLKGLTQKELDEFKIFFGANEKGTVKRYFFTKNLNYNNIHDFLNDNRNINSKNIKIYKEYYSGNILKLKIYSEINGYLTFVDNYDPNWFATVNDQEVEIIKFLNSYKSIKISKGASKVLFYYNPWQIK